MREMAPVDLQAYFLSSQMDDEYRSCRQDVKKEFLPGCCTFNLSLILLGYLAFSQSAAPQVKMKDHLKTGFKAEKEMHGCLAGCDARCYMEIASKESDLSWSG